MIFVFEALTSRPHILQYSSSKSRLCYRSSEVLPKIAIPSAKSKRIQTKSSINNPLFILSCKNNSKYSRKRETKTGAIISPCLNPIEYSKQFEKELQCLTQDFTLWYISLMILSNFR